ncbi:MAG: PilZ domain-containing protein [Desulfobulbaceae bacterium]|nr:PilZ domain-containing protein [Desulfobulbaceae bacterium]
MEKKTSWDDISSMELEMDDSPENNQVEKRAVTRLLANNVINVLVDKVKVIYVKVATRNGELPNKGSVENIHQQGMCFSMPGHGLSVKEPIIIGALLGKRVIKTQAIVRWETEEKAGIEFKDLNEDDEDFLKDLHSAQAFGDRP